ncbi:MAG: alpha/beta fold hydrolase [bacterium]|nr:alpha/beta fold hydrolase [bacterium]MCY3631866.1 alpha/beta fold hydrolase [bacterium]
MSETTTPITEEDTSRTLRVDHGVLHYHEVGHGPPLVMLHGSGPGATGWANFGENLAAFAPHFRCLVLDLPGFGGSYAPPTNLVLHGAEAVTAFVDGLGLDAFSLLGNSLGGKFAAQVAAARPDQVRRLATIGGVGLPLLSPLPSEGISRLVDFVENPTRELLIAWMRSMVFDPATLTEELIDRRWEAATEPEALANIRQIYSREKLSFLRDVMLDNTNEFVTLRGIQAPTLVTWGRDDRVTPLDGLIPAMRLIRRCEVHIFPNCGHWSMIERKDEFERVVIEFLTRDEPETTP